MHLYMKWIYRLCRLCTCIVYVYSYVYLYARVSLQPEPSNEYVGKSELDADMEVVSPMKSHYAEGDASMSPSIAASMSALFPSPNTMSNNNESQIRSDLYILYLNDL